MSQKLDVPEDSLRGGGPDDLSRSRSKGGGHTHHRYGDRVRPVWMFQGLAVQRILKKRGRVYFFVEGWPRPVPQNARLALPPIPYHATHGPAARREARYLMALAKRKKISLGPWTQASLQRVARGERPLEFCEWKRVVDYLERAEVEREASRRRAMPPKLSLKLTPGRPSLGWTRSAI